jgi:mono/diheme cytochrome c family protein
MSPLVNSVLGILFLVIGAAATFLMYYLWGFPYDHETHTSAAPRSLVRVHRCLGIAYLTLYVYFLVQMVPRLWNYQVEFPARTVAHLMLGMTIGAILIIKLVIVRWFKHMESGLIPQLGTSLLICTTLLIGLSAPFAFRERYLQQTALGNLDVDTASLLRVRGLLQAAGFDDERELDRLASPAGLHQGQEVLTGKCVLCHDLRTVLARPRTPDNWLVTVQRMAERSVLFEPIHEEEQAVVTAYLVAISPQLQVSAHERRTEERQGQDTLEAVRRAVELLAQWPADHDRAHAKLLYEAKCSQCHDLQQVIDAPPKSDQDVQGLVSRMVAEGLSGSAEELAEIMWHLRLEHVK